MQNVTAAASWDSRFRLSPRQAHSSIEKSVSLSSCTVVCPYCDPEFLGKVARFLLSGESVLKSWLSEERVDGLTSYLSPNQQHFWQYHFMPEPRIPYERWRCFNLLVFIVINQLSQYICTPEWLAKFLLCRDVVCAVISLFLFILASVHRYTKILLRLFSYGYDCFCLRKEKSSILDQIIRICILQCWWSMQ